MLKKFENNQRGQNRFYHIFNVRQYQYKRELLLMQSVRKIYSKVTDILKHLQDKKNTQKRTHLIIFNDFMVKTVFTSDKTGIYSDWLGLLSTDSPVSRSTGLHAGVSWNVRKNLQLPLCVLFTKVTVDLSLALKVTFLKGYWDGSTNLCESFDPTIPTLVKLLVYDNYVEEKLHNTGTYHYYHSASTRVRDICATCSLMNCTVAPIMSCTQKA